MHSGEQDQERLLDEAASVVKEQAYYMKKAIDVDNLRDALKHSSNLICELRTSLLSPKNYYELYMLVFQELLHLAAFFTDKARHGRKMSELYESVQHAGNILPRLYLLITVGAAYIKSKEATPRQILKDMSELTKGVQHPMRGLFLRYYLSQMCKDKLPDTGSEYEGPESGDIEDAFEFILTNFSQSSRLWIRLQSQGPVKDKQRREKERHDLRVLVGANLVRMSQLDGLSLQLYCENVLPKLVDQIISSKDAMAQQYLLDCIIQVFPDEFHLRTLETLLGACTKVISSVDLKHIMVNLMTRLAAYVQQNENIVPPEIDIFNLFRTHLQTIFERVPEKEASDDAAALLELLAAFLNFTLTLYPDRVHYVDIILGSTVDLLFRYNYTGIDGEGKKLEGVGVETVVELLSTPLRSLSLEVLSLDHYPNLLRMLDFDTRKQVAISMVETVLEANLSLSRVDDVNRFFSFIGPLIKDDEDTPVDEAVSEDFIAEQQQVCKLVHQIRSDDPEEVLSLATAARSFFGQGGPQRMKYTLVPLVHLALKLLPRIDEQVRQVIPEDEGTPAQHPLAPKKVLQFVYKTCAALVSCAPETAFSLWLVCARVSELCTSISDGAYCVEFLTQALICFEEEINDSREQFRAIALMVSTLRELRTLSTEEYETMASKLTQHGAKLLKKPQQCRAILLCSHLFWCDAKMDSHHVLQCLQKCLKIADSAIQASASNVGLFVEILDAYIHYFEAEIPDVNIQYITSLISLCHEHCVYAGKDNEEACAARRHFLESLNFLRARKVTEEWSLRYAELPEDCLTPSF